MAVLFPHPAAGQRVFAVQSEVTVRADSFACKERAELDRLLQRNQSGGFTSGTQLYDYLKAHKCVGLTAGRARVFVPRPVRLHSRSEEQQDKHLSLRLDASRDAVEITMTYEGIEYAIRAGLGRNEWVLLISFPDNVGGNPSVINFSGARNDAIAEAKKRIDNWLKRLEKKKRAAVSSRPNSRAEPIAPAGRPRYPDG